MDQTLNQTSDQPRDETHLGHSAWLLSRRTAFVVAGCLLVSIASVAILVYGPIGGGGRSRGQSLGQIARTVSNVKWKPASEFSWHKAGTAHEVFAKDSVRTGEGSSALVKLLDGREVELSENTLFIVDASKDLSLSFVQGTAVIREGNEDQKLTIAADGKRKIERLRYRLLQPEPQESLYTVEGQPTQIQFKWQGLSAAKSDGDSVILQVSKDPRFNPKRTQTSALSASADGTLLSLADGKFYFRLATAAGEALTEARSFFVRNASALKPVFPEGSSAPATITQQADVRFTWATDLESADLLADARHSLEIAEDSSFEKISLRRDIEASTGVALVPQLPVGKYYWRTVSAYRGGIRLESPARSFELRKIDQLAIQPTSPAQGASIALAPGKSSLRLQWQMDLEVSGPVEYALEVVSKSTGAASVKERTQAPSFELKGLAPGQYRWRVQALAQGKALGATEWQDFSAYGGEPIALQSPKKDESIRYWTDPPSVRFAWAQDPALKSSNARYKLEVARDAEFKSIVWSKDTESAEAELDKDESEKLGEGTYHWRVRELDPSGQMLRSSAGSRFALGLHPMLPAPSISGISRNQSFDLMKTPELPTIVWNKLEDAESYDVVIRKKNARGEDRSPASETTAFQKSITDTELKLPELKEGQYVLELRPRDRSRRVGAPATIEFSVSYGKRISAPKLKSAVVQ